MAQNMRLNDFKRCKRSGTLVPLHTYILIKDEQITEVWWDKHGESFVLIYTPDRAYVKQYRENNGLWFDYAPYVDGKPIATRDMTKTLKLLLDSLRGNYTLIWKEEL